MSSRLPPRYLPTLTEVVDPQVWSALTGAAIPPVQAAPVHLDGDPVEAKVIDRDLLIQQVIALVKPQLEAELRTVAQELFEAQYSAMLPSLHLQIEEAVREAVELARPESTDRAN